MASDIAVIMCFFNPCGYLNQYTNIQTCITNLLKQNVPEIVVLMLDYIAPASELASSDYQSPPLPPEVKVIKIQTNSICFHQYALYNIGLQYTTKPKIVLLDADIMFEEDNWVEKVSKTLDTKDIIQPYLFTNYLRADNSIDFTRISFTASHFKTTDVEKYQHLGAHIGHTWAFKRKVLPNDKIFPFTVMGSGDDVFSTCALKRYSLTPRLSYLNPKGQEYLRDFITWNKSLSVGFAHLTIKHLFHGDLLNRQYNNRHEKLAAKGFTLNEMIFTDQGLPVFKNPEKWNEHFFQFFQNRKEDN